MEFSRDFLINTVHKEPDGAKIVEDNLVETDRWSILHELIFQHDGKYYRTNYSVGATEIQDEGPFEFSDEWVECKEVEPFEKKVIGYREVK